LKTNLVHMTCDACGKEVVHDKDRFGLSPFAGWYHLGQFAAIVDGHALSVDLCGPRCLAEFVRERWPEFGEPVSGDDV